MGTWNSRGLRGSVLEDMINYTIERLRNSRLAVIQKIPTPITPIEMDKATRHITLAYFDQKSTVDYIGAVQGYPVCFDAKECASDTLPLHNIHPHQVAFMEDFEAQGGIAFLLIYYSERHIYYYMPCREMKFFWDRMENGGRKSIRMDELKEERFFHEKNNLLPILESIDKDLEERENRDEHESDPYA